MKTEMQELIEEAENAEIWLVNCLPIGEPTKDKPLPRLRNAIAAARASEGG